MNKEDFIKEELNYHLKIAQILSFILLTLTLVLLQIFDFLSKNPKYDFVTPEIKTMLVVIELIILIVAVGSEFRLALKCLNKLKEGVE